MPGNRRIPQVQTGVGSGPRARPPEAALDIETPTRIMHHMWTTDGASLDRSRRAHTSLVDLAYEALAESVLDRYYAPGTRVTIESLAKQLDMSITPVREALSRAAANGLVTLDANRGYRIATMLTEREFHEIFAARRVLELEALRSAAIQPYTIKRLTDIVESMPTLDHGPMYRTFRAFNREDHHFHRTLVELSGNRFLLRAWDSLNFHLQISRFYAGQGVIDFADALGEHAAIAEAVANHDNRGAIKTAQAHISNAERRLAALIPGTAFPTAPGTPAPT